MMVAAGLVVRALTWPDIARLVEVEREIFPTDPWAPESWWAELAHRPRREYVLAEDADGNVAGYAGIDHGGDVSDIMTVAVTPAARGTGLGDRLLSRLEDAAVARGAEAVILEVRADNEPAVRLYRRHGYAVIQTRRRYYQPGDIDALVMRKLLGEQEIRR
ncbi:MAG: ribosomal protein S18-alanine N-acetyltransferase [Tetrasphaera jenkinsii]|jgi:ribosomal-protein-alanine N-acetyltransferase|nr:ribosomal protein S18-alanine N-acetyltransferase [Tetrasphaera jenkinsii]